MKLEQLLKKELEKFVKGRERRNKVAFISFLLQKTHPAVQGISKEVMQEIVDETIALERYWRKILLENPHLRGQDYSGQGFKEKRQLEEESMMGLGYEPGAEMKLKFL